MRHQCVVRGAWFNPAGFTLLEVVVALALVGMILGLAAVSIASLSEPPEGAAYRALIAARASAIRSGHPVVVTATSPDTGRYHTPHARHVLFLPDGRAVGAGMDMLTGASIGTR